MSNQTSSEQVPRAAVPADVQAPDRIAWGLTARQLAILAVAGVCGYGAYQLLAPLLPAVAWAAVAMPAFGLLLGVVLGRRDGIGLDAWLLAAWRHHRTPRLHTPTTGNHPRRRGRGVAQLVHTATRPQVPAPLMLPAEAISEQGVITRPGATAAAAVVACGTVNLSLRTPTEQAALVSGFGRWLNSLATPAQIVVSTHRADLQPHAEALAERAGRLPHPALTAAAGDHAAYLAELGRSRDPLRRQVLLLVHAESQQPPAAASRAAEATARTLSALGVDTSVLDGAAVTAALAAAVDPYSPPVAGGRARPEIVITSTTGQEV